MKLFRYLIIAAAAALVLAAFVAYWFYSSLNSPVEHSSAEEYLTIEKGKSPTEILAVLAEKGIISSPFAVRTYLRFSGGAGDLKAGDYRFRSPITALEVLEELRKGNERTVKLTIPEGWTRYEIAERIAANFPTEPPTDAKAVLYLMDNTESVKDFAPDANNLEGFLYPTTYSFPLETTPEEVVKRMVGEFRSTWQPEWTNRAKEMGRTPFEIVTIASLIENESKVDAERELVASVIYNRLDRGMALGIDATNVYIAKMLGRWDGTIHRSDIEINHPYNTRKISGLPPGPISSASKTAIEAALNPAKTEYLFYVLDVEKNDGSHLFFSAASDFERAKAKYQRWLREQRAKP